MNPKYTPLKRFESYHTTKLSLLRELADQEIDCIQNEGFSSNEKTRQEELGLYIIFRALQRNEDSIPVFYWRNN